MKKLNVPACNDNDIAYSLAVKDKGERRAHLQYFLPVLLCQYKNYIVHKGNPWFVSASIIQPCMKKALQSFYYSRLTELNVISEIRNNVSPDICPMCGSEKTSTVDHYLPQANYPEFSMFTKNLVPACDCNSKRKNIVKGNNLGARVLHPYFDVCMQRRLVAAHIAGNFIKPKIQLVVCCGPILERTEVEFHVEEVLKKTNILNWLDKKWSTLINQPDSILVKLPELGQVDGVVVKNAIVSALKAKVVEFGTPNSWMSIFYHGLLYTPNLIDWLVTRINSLRNGTVVPE